MPDKARMIETVFQRELFDPAWYRDTYPDVGMLGMEPDYHYRTYGHLMGRAPAAEFADDPHRFGALLLPPPVKGRELQRAHEIARNGDHDLGIGYARLHVPKELDYTIDTLHANAALARNDRDGWLRHLNSYIGHFGAAPVRLRDGEMLLDRFTTDGLPIVTGGPLISVIMPAWNAEKTVRAAANSILAQTWRNLELLIIDDASEDGTWGVMQEIATSDERVKIWRNPINVGPYVSKNIVLSMAQGEWITGHDADDWAHPQRLSRHHDDSSQRDALASITCMLRVDQSGYISKLGGISSFSMDGVARVASISCLFHGDTLRKRIGFWDSVRFGADSEMIARTQSLIGDKFHALEAISMICLDAEDSLTNHPLHGIHANNGKLSNSRATYKDSWSTWIKSRSSRDVYLPLVQKNRRYTAVPEMIVPLEHIKSSVALIDAPTEERNFIVASKPTGVDMVHGENIGLDQLSSFLFKHVPALIEPVEGARFGERAREWAWRWGYWGRAAGTLYLMTRDVKYLTLLDEMHDGLLAVRDDRLGLVDDVRNRVMQSWGTVITGKYDRGLRACEVESSGLMVLPWANLLFTDTKGLIPETIREKWTTTLLEVISAHADELIMHPASGGGYFMSPWFDHKVEPLNHSHLFGAACAYSYGISGNTTHRDLALSLYRFFRYNWRHEKDGLVSWAYNPTESDKTLGPESSAYGERNHKVLIGPELFYKASVSIELPIAMFQVGILPGDMEEIQLISRSLRKSIFQNNFKVNYYISRNKRHLCSEPEQGNMPVLRPHYMCGLELLGDVDLKMSQKLASIVANRPDFFPKGWLTGPASVMAGALRISRDYHLSQLKSQS